MLKIQIKQTKDIKEILNIATEMIDYFTKEGIKDLKKDLKSDNIYGAYSKNKLIGFMLVKKSDKQAVEISWLAIAKDFQNKGIGTYFVKNILNKLSKKGFRICFVRTLAETVKDTGYAKTRKFYKKLGFNTLVIIDPYPYWSPGNPCQILAVSLPIK